ncbi:MAG: type II CAAX endopeptidase family protein [Bacillota bacterium]
MNRSVDWRKVGLYILLTYFISYAGFYIYLAMGGTWGDQILVGVLYMFIPLLVTIIVRKLIYRQQIIRPLGVSFRLNRWFLVAIALPVAFFALTTAVGLLFPGVQLATSIEGILQQYSQYYTEEQMVQLREQFETAPIHPFWLGLVSGVAAGCTINAVAAFGEELGWRGFMLHELKPLGFWKSSLIIGVVWGVWHMPAILQGHNYPENPVPGVFMMTAFTLLLSPLFSYVTLRAGSVLAAAVFHGVINGLAGLSLMVTSGGSDLTVGLTGLAGLLVLAAANLLLWVSGRIPALQREKM